jgi:RNA polymerase sigma-70 factor (ECF subfamily)
MALPTAPGLNLKDLAGIRSLLERKCGSAAIAEDLLSEAVKTSLEKLGEGAIARPEQLAGYVFRVALNHLRNYRRTDKSARTTTTGIEEINDERQADAATSMEQARWAKLMREVLSELPNVRDRELIARFYLEEEDKDALCARLQLSGEHFNRVIHRARERFRELLEARGFRREDFLSLAFTLVV